MIVTQYGGVQAIKFCSFPTDREIMRSGRSKEVFHTRCLHRRFGDAVSDGGEAYQLSHFGLDAGNMKLVQNDQAVIFTLEVS